MKDLIEQIKFYERYGYEKQAEYLFKEFVTVFIKKEDTLGGVLNA